LSILASFAQKQRRFFTYLFNSLWTVTQISETLFVKCIIAATYIKAQRMSRIAFGHIASACAADLENSRIHFAVNHRDNCVNEKSVQQSSCPGTQYGTAGFQRRIGRLRLKCDGTRAETRFRLSAKWTSPFK